MSCLWDELPVAALGFSSLLVCVVFLPQGGGFVGIRIDRTIVPPIVHFLEALLDFVSVVAESSENGPLYPACLLNFEIRK